MNILVIHRYPLQQAKETNGSIFSFLKCLVDEGCNVNYLSYRNIKKTEIDRVNLYEIPFFLKRSSALDKWIKSLLWCLLAPLYCFFLVKRRKINVIYCDDSFPFYPLFIKCLCPKTKLIIRLGDLQTGYIFPGKNILSRKCFTFFHKLEINIWKKMDGLIPISEEFKIYINKISKIDSKKVKMVPESYIELENTKLDAVLKLFEDKDVPKNKKLLLFHGSMEKTKGLKTLLDSIVLINKHYNHDFHFILVGSGSEFKQHLDYVKSKKIKNVTLTGWIEFSLIGSIINCCNAGIVMRELSLANNFIVTMAFIQYAVLGKTIIAPNQGEISRIGKKFKSVYLYKPDNPMHLAKTIYKCSKNESCNFFSTLKLQDYASREFNSVKVGKQLSNVIIDLAGG